MKKNVEIKESEKCDFNEIKLRSFDKEKHAKETAYMLKMHSFSVSTILIKKIIKQLVN